MIIVAYSTFDWHSLKSLHHMPKSETIVMLANVLATVFTHNLAIGVTTGVVTPPPSCSRAAWPTWSP